MAEALLLFWGRVNRNLPVIALLAHKIGKEGLPLVCGRAVRNLPVISLTAEALHLVGGRAVHNLPVLASQIMTKVLPLVGAREETYLLVIAQLLSKIMKEDLLLFWLRADRNLPAIAI